MINVTIEYHIGNKVVCVRNQFCTQNRGFCHVHNTIHMNYFVSQTMKDVSRLLKYSFIIPLKAKYVWQNMLAAREKSKRDGEFSFLEHDSEGEIFTTC